MQKTNSIIEKIQDLIYDTFSHSHQVPKCIVIGTETYADLIAELVHYDLKFDPVFGAKIYDMYSLRLNYGGSVIKVVSAVVGGLNMPIGILVED